MRSPSPRPTHPHNASCADIIIPHPPIASYADSIIPPAAPPKHQVHQHQATATPGPPSRAETAHCAPYAQPSCSGAGCSRKQLLKAAHHISVSSVESTCRVNCVNPGSNTVQPAPPCPVLSEITSKHRHCGVPLCSGAGCS